MNYIIITAIALNILTMASKVNVPPERHIVAIDKDSNQVGYVFSRSGNYEVFICDKNGAVIFEKTAFKPSFSPDKKYFIMRSQARPYSFEIFNTNGELVKNISLPESRQHSGNLSAIIANNLNYVICGTFSPSTELIHLRSFIAIYDSSDKEKQFNGTIKGSKNEAAFISNEQFVYLYDVSNDSVPIFLSTQLCLVCFDLDGNVIWEKYITDVLPPSMDNMTRNSLEIDCENKRINLLFHEKLETGLKTKDSLTIKNNELKYIFSYSGNLIEKIRGW